MEPLNHNLLVSSFERVAGRSSQFSALKTSALYLGGRLPCDLVKGQAGGSENSFHGDLSRGGEEALVAADARSIAQF